MGEIIKKNILKEEIDYYSGVLLKDLDAKNCRKFY